MQFEICGFRASSEFKFAEMLRVGFCCLWPRRLCAVGNERVCNGKIGRKTIVNLLTR